MISQRRRAPGGRAFDFFLESSFIEVGRDAALLWTAEGCCLSA